MLHMHADTQRFLDSSGAADNPWLGCFRTLKMIYLCLELMFSALQTTLFVL